MPEIAVPKSLVPTVHEMSTAHCKIPTGGQANHLIVT
jgi:hypothetical protein